MTGTIKEVLEFVRENDVKFIRLSFCDLLGVQKNISVIPEELPTAFENGISFDAHAVAGFRDITDSDLFLVPDPTTLIVLPWRPGPGRVIRFYCDIKNPDGTPFPGDGRYFLKKVAERCKSMGYTCRIGTECEFYLFKTDERGEPTDETLDYGSYFDISPLDKGENIRREICLCLQEMGLNPLRSHHERGPGQNEITFRYSDIVEAADNFLTFKSTVKAIAARNGLFASFMPKPILDESGSGLHVNISLSQNGHNIFSNGVKKSRAAESFIAGIMDKTPEMTIFLNPIANSYERLGRNEAPAFVSWSHKNRSQLVRIPAAHGDRFRMELRSPDPAVNPYIAFALIINAGLDGISKGLTLQPPVDADLYTADEAVTNNLTPIPSNMYKAIELAKSSSFIRDTIGEEILSKYLALKQEEADEFSKAGDKEAFFRKRYFSKL